LFRQINGASDRIRVPVRAVMQAGTFGTVPAVSVLAFLVGRKRLAASLAVGGTIAWLGAKLAKPFGGRARPHGVLPDVTVREGIEGDLGWVSGHTAVATTLAFIAAEEFPRAARPVLAAIVGTVGFGRMYVGAHLPHDVVGGAGLGMMISAVIPSADAG
jgi:membrane-associated phospholipid phosphatase